MLRWVNGEWWFLPLLCHDKIISKEAVLSSETPRKPKINNEPYIHLVSKQARYYRTHFPEKKKFFQLRPLKQEDNHHIWVKTMCSLSLYVCRLFSRQ